LLAAPTTGEAPEDEMAVSNDTSTMLGNFKNIYTGSYVDYLPASSKLMREMPMGNVAATGDYYAVPVEVQYENGITYAAPRSGVTTLLSSNAGKSEQALVEGYQIFGRAQVDYEAMARASAAGTKAFQQATRLVVKRLTKSSGKRAEIALLHGKRGWGTIDSVGGSGTTRAWVITVGTFAPAIWAGMKDATLDIFAANYSGSKVNSNAAVVITSMDFATRTINVSGNATDLTNIIAGMQIFPETASPTTDMPGIDYTVSLTSGNNWNISATTYEMWRGNVVTSGGAPGFGQIIQGVQRAAELGLEDDTVAIVSPAYFSRLTEDYASLQRFDYSYDAKKGKQGIEDIQFHGQTGFTKIMPHMYQKPGLVHIVSMQEWQRIGAQDLDFKFPDNTSPFWQVPDKGAWELRIYGSFAPFCEAPSHQVVIQGITYS
jgi:hypothetical protein